MIMHILGKKLEDAGLGKQAETIFHHQMSAEIVKGVFFRYPLTGVKIDPYLPKWYKARVQVIVRHKSISEGEKYASDINEALTIIGDEFFPEDKIRISRFYPESLPVRFPRLDGNLLEWSTHFEAIFSEET